MGHDAQHGASGAPEPPDGDEKPDTVRTVLHRGDLSRDFGRIPNATLRAVQLPALAYKILHYALSHAESYLVNAEHLEREFPEGRRAIAAACQALEATGHLERPRARRERGRWTPAPWIFHATPASSTAGSADGSEPSTPTALPVSAMRSTAPPSAATRQPGGQVLEDQSKKTSEEDQRTSDDDLARAHETDPIVENPNPRAEPTPPGTSATADTGPPAPHQPMPTAGTSPAGSTPSTEENEGQTPAVDASIDLVQALIGLVREVTGQSIDRELAEKGVAMVLHAKDGTPRAVSDPVAYLRTAVEAAPTRFLASVIPPQVGGRWESKAARRARGFDELRTWAAEATDGGKRLDNTGTVVITEDGQPASVAPAEPLSDPWGTGTAPGGWMGTPAPQTASRGVPAWCGSCGGDAGHSPAVMKANTAYRTDTGRPAGAPCPRCHPGVVQAAA